MSGLSMPRCLSTQTATCLRLESVWRFFRVCQPAKGRQHLSRRRLRHPVAFGDPALDLCLHAPPERALHVPAGVPHPPDHPLLPALYSHGCLACNHTLTHLRQGLRAHRPTSLHTAVLLPIHVCLSVNWLTSCIIRHTWTSHGAL